MPIYEYKCNDCGHQFETFVKGNEQVICPNCRSSNLSRLISSCCFSFGGDSSKSNTSVKSTKSCSSCSSFS